MPVVGRAARAVAIVTACVVAPPAASQGAADVTITSFSQAIAEVTEARIWAGLHFRTADLQGRQLGRNVADYAIEQFLGGAD